MTLPERQFLHGGNASRSPKRLRYRTKPPRQLTFGRWYRPNFGQRGRAVPNGSATPSDVSRGKTRRPYLFLISIPDPEAGDMIKSPFCSLRYAAFGRCQFLRRLQNGHRPVRRLHRIFISRLSISRDVRCPSATLPSVYDCRGGRKALEICPQKILSQICSPHPKTSIIKHDPLHAGQGDATPKSQPSTIVSSTCVR